MWEVSISTLFISFQKLGFFAADVAALQVDSHCPCVCMYFPFDFTVHVFCQVSKWRPRTECGYFNYWKRDILCMVLCIVKHFFWWILEIFNMEKLNVSLLSFCRNPLLNIWVIPVVLSMGNFFHFVLIYGQFINRWSYFRLKHKPFKNTLA